MSALLGMAFTACTENFDPEVGPQSYAPESPLAVSDVTMTSEASSINIESLIEAGNPITIGTVSVREGAMPANTIMKAAVDFSADANFEKFITIPADGMEESNVVTVSANALQDAYFNDITRNPKTVDLYMRTTLYTVTGGEAEAIIGKPGENYYAVQNVQFTPLFKVQISPAYYVIGAAGGWTTDGARTQKFEHSDADVYDDPVFTITIDSGGDDCWFAIGDDAALTAIDGGDWTQLLGTKGESEDLTGSMDFRYNLGGDHSFHVTGAKKLKITLNMMEYSYTITPLNFAEYIYEAGVNNNWGADAQPLYCPDGNGTYTGFFYAQDADWSDGKGAFKFTGAFNSWDEGNYGTGTINDDGLSGTLIDDGGSGNVLAAPGFYKAEVNLANMTYSLTPITGIGLIGPAQAGGWDTDTDLTYNPETRAWEGTIELAADEFKFRANDGWDINWGGTFDDLTQDGPNLKIETAGKYFIQFFPLCETKSYAVITAVE